MQSYERGHNTTADFEGRIGLGVSGRLTKTMGSVKVTVVAIMAGREGLGGCETLPVLSGLADGIEDEDRLVVDALDSTAEGVGSDDPALVVEATVGTSVDRGGVMYGVD